MLGTAERLQNRIVSANQRHMPNHAVNGLLKALSTSLPFERLFAQPVGAHRRSHLLQTVRDYRGGSHG
jgi:hypothetical protein